MRLSLLRSFMRRRLAISELTLIAAMIAVATYVAYAVDIFHGENGIGAGQAKIDLDEALAIGVLVALSLLVFGARRYLDQRRETARRTAAERKIRALAYQDGLTGLANRRQFDEALRAAVAAPPRAGGAHGVFMLDLNGFKQINDVFGHGVGDDTLVVVAQRLLSAMREGDLVARFGGDEFAILARHLAGPEAATTIALRVIEALEAPIAAGGALHQVGAGIGVALAPGDSDRVDEVLRMADVALYRAKAERRSAVRFFEPEMDARVRERAMMEAALRDALSLGRIEPVYRATIDLATGGVASLEASPRWIDPVAGEVPLERFVAIAEETGLIHVLAEKTLREACQAAANWPGAVRLTVDLYPGQLKDKNLAVNMLAVVDACGLARGRLEAQITESAMVADMEGAQMLLGALRDGGVRIALDNFGTGYSSLYHLRNLKLDKVRIDRSFVQVLGQDAESENIVRALVGLSHGLGLTIVAEGVDGADQERSLKGAGCQQVSGEVASGPMTAAAASALIARIAA